MVWGVGAERGALSVRRGREGGEVNCRRLVGRVVLRSRAPRLPTSFWKFYSTRSNVWRYWSIGCSLWSFPSLSSRSGQCPVFPVFLFADVTYPSLCRRSIPPPLVLSPFIAFVLLPTLAGFIADRASPLSPPFSPRSFIHFLTVSGPIVPLHHDFAPLVIVSVSCLRLPPSPFPPRRSGPVAVW